MIEKMVEKMLNLGECEGCRTGIGNHGKWLKSRVCFKYSLCQQQEALVVNDRSAMMQMQLTVAPQSKNSEQGSSFKVQSTAFHFPQGTEKRERERWVGLGWVGWLKAVKHLVVYGLPPLLHFAKE